MSETWTDRRFILGSEVKIGDIVSIPGRPDVTVREIETSFDGWVKVNPGTQEQRLGLATQYVKVIRPTQPGEQRGADRMSEPLIRRRSLPSSLRYLARKLDEPLSDAERVGIALTLNSLADEAERTAPPAASKPDLLQALADALTALAEAEENPELEYDHIDCVSGTVWWGSPLWTARRHPEMQQQGAGQVRPDEEPS